MRWIFACGMLAALAACSSKQDDVDVATTASRPDATSAAMQSLATSAVLPPTAGYASSPDRGAVAEYRIEAGRRQGAYTWYPSRISEQHALRAIVDGQLRITSPTGAQLSYRYQRHIEHASGDWTWIGRLEGGKANEEALITFGAKAVFGSLSETGKPALQLVMRDGASWLVATDAGVLKQANQALTDPRRQDYFVPRKRIATAKAAAAADGADAQKAGPTVIDLVIGYTAGFASGGASAALTRLNFLVDVTNQAYSNSQIDAQVRLVHAMQVSYADATDNGTALEELTGFRAPSTQLPPAPAFSALRAARDQYGADLVSLVRKFSVPENGGCGIAWMIGGDLQGVEPTDDYFGYSVVSDGSDDSRFCAPESMAHELGHNMGSAHDDANSDSPGAFTYSYGYKTPQPNGTGFHTVMAYGDDGQPGMRIFSNPRISTCLGLPCGTAAADNARSLTQTIPVVATFRGTVVSPPVRRVTRDVDGDGRSDFMMYSGSMNRFAWWRMNGASIQQGLSIISGVGYTPVGTGDFNGDGKGDLMWLRSASRLLLLQVSNGAGFVNVFQDTLDNGWNLVGAADVTGDGKSDVLLHNPTTREFKYLAMNGGVVTAVRTIGGVGAGYRVAGYGDVNADGKADVFWTSSARDLYVWASNGETFTSARVADYGAGFNIVGMADVDGDGRADVLFHNPTTRIFHYRLMRGFSSVGNRSISGVGAGYSIAAYGDFNSDGKADLAWSHPGTRLVYVWIGNGTTFASAFTGAYPSGWQPAPPANR
jgi:hypothetical protein